MNFDKHLFRCSTLGHLMTESKSSTEYYFDGLLIDTKKYNKYIENAIQNRDFEILTKLESKKVKADSTELSETAKTYLIDVYISVKYGRNNDIESRAINKGLQVEEDSLTLYYKHTNLLFVKNSVRLYNEYLSGLPDVIEKDYVLDIKSSWDIYTFFKTKTKKINNMYYWQLQGYMDLANKKSSKLVYCLIDTPITILNDLKQRLLWKMGALTDENKDYQEACIELEKLHSYSDIPTEERIVQYDIEYNKIDIEFMKDKIQTARNFLNSI